METEHKSDNRSKSQPPKPGRTAALDRADDLIAMFDDGLWHAEDYDDEPRSHGNFGLDPCIQMMEAEAEDRKRAEFKRELDLAYEFMRERRGLRKQGGSDEPKAK